MKNNFDQTYKQLISKINESIIDIPKNSLDPSVFEFLDEGTPILHPAIKLQIVKDVAAISDIITVKDFYIVGSILTYQYNPRTDIDVLILVNKEDFSEILKSRAFTFLKNINGRHAQGTTHPINYYIEQNEFNEDKYHGIYNVASERWVKEPIQIDINVRNYLDKFHDTVSNIDLMAAELRRDIIDYDGLKTLSPKQLQQLKKELKEKLDKIEEDVIGLVDSYQNIKQLRKLAFEKDLTLDEISKYSRKQALPENVIYKLLERYYYIDFIKKLHTIIKGSEKLEADDLPKIIRAGMDLWKI